MPYTWYDTSTDAQSKRLELWPYRSLPRRGFAAFILGTFTLITIPLYGLLGTVLVWGLLPFLLLAVAGLWWALEHSYKTAQLHEELTIDPERLHLRRVTPKGEVLEWDCNSYWARVSIHPKGGPVAHYITLGGSGREVEIGAFLSEPERMALYGELQDVLRKVKATPSA